jgi:hypothetical protein
MIGAILGESTGKRLLRRVLSSDPLTVEVTFEDAGNMLGVNNTGFGTYVAELRADGTAIGNGEGAMITHDGEVISWKGSGLGTLKEGGAVSYRGILYYRTASQKLAKLNTVPGVFEYEVAADGSTRSKVWEWK